MFTRNSLRSERTGVRRSPLSMRSTGTANPPSMCLSFSLLQPNWTMRSSKTPTRFVKHASKQSEPVPVELVFSFRKVSVREGINRQDDQTGDLVDCTERSSPTVQKRLLTGIQFNNGVIPTLSRPQALETTLHER